MTFTDEDLKRLEKLPDNIVITLGVGPSVKLKAIIARLEAAEKIAEWGCHTRRCSIKADEACDCEMPALFEAWRKAAGK